MQSKFFHFKEKTPRETHFNIFFSSFSYDNFNFIFLIVSISFRWCRLIRNIYNNVNKKKKWNYGKLCNFHLKWKLFLYYTKEHLFYNLIFYFLNCYLTFSFCWREKKNFFTSFLTKYIYIGHGGIFFEIKKNLLG